MWKNIIKEIVFFVTGFIIAIIIVKPEEMINRKEKMRAIAMQNSYFENFKHDLDCYQIDLSKSNCDDELKLYHNMQTLCQQCVDMEHSILVHSINIDSLKLFMENVGDFLSELDQSSYVEDSKIVLSSINSKQFGTSEKLNQLYIIENILIYHYLRHIYENSIIFSQVELINNAESDVIHLGEQYASKLIFSVQDITGNNNFYEIMNDQSLQPINMANSEFREFPEKRGHYHHDILLMSSGFYKGHGCKVPIDYYVK